MELQSQVPESYTHAGEEFSTEDTRKTAAGSEVGVDCTDWFDGEEACTFCESYFDLKKATAFLT